MEKIKDFLANNYFWIVMVLFFGIFLNTCSQTKTNKRLVRQNNQMVMELDSMRHEMKNYHVNKNELDLMLKIEGLKSEKRMLQSCDRKVWDMNRQTEIDKEIEVEENKLRNIKK
jgi:hypothetical protein